jgi:hypothetical protein
VPGFCVIRATRQETKGLDSENVPDDVFTLKFEFAGAPGTGDVMLSAPDQFVALESGLVGPGGRDFLGPNHVRRLLLISHDGTVALGCLKSSKEPYSLQNVAAVLDGVAQVSLSSKNN